MTDIIIDSKFRVKKELVPINWDMIFKGDLTFTSRNFDKYIGGNDVYSISLYEEKDGYIYLPVKYGYDRFRNMIKNGNLRVEDRRTRPIHFFSFKDDEMRKNKRYYDRQIVCITKVLNHLLNSEDHGGFYG
jgi:hypothetical protein